MINKFNILTEAKYFSSGIFRNYFVFIPAKKCIKYFTGTTQINLRKFNETSGENIENITKLDNQSNPPCWFPHYNSKTVKAVTLAFYSIQ